MKFMLFLKWERILITYKIQFFFDSQIMSNCVDAKSTKWNCNLRDYRFPIKKKIISFLCLILVHIKWFFNAFQSNDTQEVLLLWFGYLGSIVYPPKYRKKDLREKLKRVCMRKEQHTQYRSWYYTYTYAATNHMQWKHRCFYFRIFKYKHTWHLPLQTSVATERPFVYKCTVKMCLDS